MESLPAAELDEEMPTRDRIFSLFIQAADLTDRDAEARFRYLIEVALDETLPPSEKTRRLLGHD